MTKISILFAIFICTSFSIHAQDLVGRKIITGNLSFNTINPKGTAPNTNVIIANLLYGRIKADNTYWAFGGKVYSASELGTTFGPSFERGKFISLAEKFYLVPKFGGSIGSNFKGNGEGSVDIVGYATPLNFMYQISDKFLLNASFGSASISYTSNQLYESFNLNASLNNYSGFGVFYTFK